MRVCGCIINTPLFGHSIIYSDTFPLEDTQMIPTFIPCPSFSKAQISEENIIPSFAGHFGQSSSAYFPPSHYQLPPGWRPWKPGAEVPWVLSAKRGPEQRSGAFGKDGSGCSIPTPGGLPPRTVLRGPRPSPPTILPQVA